MNAQPQPKSDSLFDTLKREYPHRSEEELRDAERRVIRFVALVYGFSDSESHREMWID